MKTDTKENNTEAPNTITKAFIRHYSDNGQTVAYVEWKDGVRTEGEPENAHILALFARAQREGLRITRETW